MDHDAEITTETVEEDVEANMEEDDHFTPNIVMSNKKDEMIE